MKKKPFSILVSATFCVFGAYHANAEVSYVETDSMVSDLFNVYSPEYYTYHGEELLLLGGWLTREEIGLDKIYLSERKNGAWTQPTEVFTKKGWAVNDPSVIQHPVHDWLFMYYTGLATEHAHDAESMISNNRVGLASSTDGGRTWTDHDIVIGKNNGVNEDGAWSPSAIVNNDEIWVYYNTNAPSNIPVRTRFELNGWRRIGSSPLTIWLWNPSNSRFEADPSPFYINIDVAKHAGKYVMLANANYKGANSLNNIHMFESLDGINFYENPSSFQNPIVQGGEGKADVLTPQFVSSPKSNSEFILYMGYRSLVPENISKRNQKDYDWTKDWNINAVVGWKMRYD